MTTPLDQRPKSGPYSGLTLNSAKRFLAQQFRAAGLDSPELDARLLVMAATDLDHADLIARGTEFIAPDAFEQICRLSERRLAGEPIDHILGYREFYARRFFINKDVLSPRPETEGLIDIALDLFGSSAPQQCLDLGTGSGAIIITLLAERLNWTGVASDVSQAALDIARKNAENLGVSARLRFQRSAWFDRLEGQFDLILSNPPYIDAAHMAALAPEVAGYDPALALYGGEDGLEAYRVLSAQAQAYLKPQGWLLLEIGYDQKDAVTALLLAAGFHNVTCRQDLAGQDRVILAQSSHK